MGNFFESLKAGLEEAIQHDLGKKTLRSKSVEFPELPAIYEPEQIIRIRDSKKGIYRPGQNPM